MKVQTVAADKMPKKRRVSRVDERQREYDDAIATLRTKPKMALTVSSSDAEQRAMRLRLQRAALRAGIKIATTYEDGTIFAKIVPSR